MFVSCSSERWSLIAFSSCFPEGPVLPLYLIVVLAVVGGVLLILNSALVACLVKKWRTHHSDAGRGQCGTRGSLILTAG